MVADEYSNWEYLVWRDWFSDWSARISSSYLVTIAAGTREDDCCCCFCGFEGTTWREEEEEESGMELDAFSF